MATEPSRTPDVDERGEALSGLRYELAHRAHVIIDADDYFGNIRESMQKAEHRLFLIGWDFDTRITLFRAENLRNLEPQDEESMRLGSFIAWLAKRRPEMEIRILKWNFAFFKFLFRGSMLLDLARWWMIRNIDFKFDSAHPVGSSHHQKIVIIDDHLAVCGGIDMTSDRWDTREHLEDHPGRILPNGKPYRPWHDATMMLEGPIARALGDVGRERWSIAGGPPLDPCPPVLESRWPEGLRAQFEDVEIGIARTRAAHGDFEEICEVEQLFLEHIARARHFIYAETQYFASRKIAEAILHRLEEPDPPEIVIINPLHADGWLEQTAMDSARQRLVAAIRRHDEKRRFRIFIPLAEKGTPIYVHAKLTIIDDEILRVGSANMNNRSMGLDTECDVFLDATRPANRGSEEEIRKLRYSLLAEHCGLEEQEVGELLDRHGSMAAMIDSLPKHGKHLAPYVLQPLSDAEKALADTELLDPERPDEILEPIGKRGLFRRGSALRRGSWTKRLRRRIKR
jgi:phosphatidylserine/phosphatidylglycerophosphate/cardiolipin synthase-like enzyme